MIQTKWMWIWFDLSFVHLTECEQEICVWINQGKNEFCHSLLCTWYAIAFEKSKSFHQIFWERITDSQ